MISSPLSREPDLVPIKSLQALFDWQGRFFLREREWALAVPLGSAKLVEVISSQVETCSKWRLDRPIGTSWRDEAANGEAESAAFVLWPPRAGLLRTLIGLGPRYQFVGRILESPDGAEISGRYRVVPTIRGFMLLWLTGVMACLAVAFGIGVWCLVNSDFGRVYGALAMVGVGFLLLFVAYLYGSLFDWTGKASRESLNAFLVGLAAAEPAPGSETPDPS